MKEDKLWLNHGQKEFGMTKHLYYDDSYRTEFSAKIQERVIIGGKPAVILDETIFYPESGGQPCDAGLLGGIRVERVEEDDSGNILHILSSPLDESIGTVTGTIDWDRRFDHMQQHTGQHVLSQAFIAVAGAATLSFHLGQETSTIDVSLPNATASILRKVEDLATRIGFEDRPVQVLNVPREELAALGIRKESRREGMIRVIDVDGFDRSACGGTHVRRTGEIGMIFILGNERYKGGTRIEFVCGYRALTEFRNDHATLGELSKLYSSTPHELPILCEKLQAEHSSLVRDKRKQEEELLAFEARDLVLGAKRTGALAVVRRIYPDRKIETLKILAQKAASHPGMVILLGASQDAAQIVVARSQDVGGDCGAIIREVTGKLGGRGGGRPELAQAGGIDAAALEAWMSEIAGRFPG
jgi:alanyl-tRNA synthetase